MAPRFADSLSMLGISEQSQVGIQNVARDLLSPTPSQPFCAPALRSASLISPPLMGAQNVRRHEPLDILSAEIASDPFCASPNSVVGTKWVLVPATYSPPRSEMNSNFVFGTGWWAESGA
jgi:hypothetical protein